MKYTKLWLLVILVAAGDIGTTVYGLSHGAEEGNPAVNEAIDEIGILPALFALKVAAISIAIIVQNIMTSHEWVPPFCLMLVWLPAVIWNALLFLP